MNRQIIVRIASLMMAVVHSSAFVRSPFKNAVQRSTPLSMAVRFDKAAGKWFTDDPEEMAGSSYGPIGSLYRAGPKPFLQHLLNPETYDQAVLKYMAQAGCDRTEAQGNMDAFLENPQDWAYQKVSEQNGGYKKDFANANMSPKQVILSTVWGLGVIYFIGSLAYNSVQDGMISDSFQHTMKLLGVDA